MIKREFVVADEYHYDRSGPLRWIASHLLRYKLIVGSWFFTSIASYTLVAVVPVLTGAAFTEVLQRHPNAGRLLAITLGIVGTVLVTGVIDIIGRYSAEFLAQRIERDAREELYLSLLSKSQTFHNRQRVGDIMARASNDVRQLNPMMSPGLDLVLNDASLGLLVPTIFIGFINPILLVAPLGFAVLFVLAIRRYINELNPISTEMRDNFGTLNAGLAETITGIEVVKAAAQEAQERNKFAVNARRYRDAFVANGNVQARYLPPLLIALALVGAFLLGVVLLVRGQLSVGNLIAYMGLMALLRNPSIISIFVFNLTQMGIAGSERILAVMREETEMDENDNGQRAAIAGDVVFDHVSFSYDGVPVLHDISFHAKAGQTVAIVGQTGAGKSTLTKLINRSYDVETGSILVDGTDVRDWSLDALRSQISTIEQDIFLFSRTVAENIAFSQGQRANHADIERAARDAQAHDFIMDFKDGYDTVVGERGVTLSGGQRQRLAIARALLTNPRILMLDDSTSAIDSATEDAIQTAIRRVLEGRTTFLITHRLSQIRWADLILVLHQGRLVDQGSHTELVERCEIYRRIFARHGKQTAASIGQ